MKYILLIMPILVCLSCSAQKKVDLDQLKFNEDMEAFVKDVPNVHKGNLFTRTDMFSYGVSKNSTYYFRDFLPAHVELLSYKGQLAGFAFKMKTFEDQEKVRAYLMEKYKLTFYEQMSKEVAAWRYSDAKTLVEFRSIPKEIFANGATGYLMIRRPDFAAEFEKLMAQ